MDAVNPIADGLLYAFTLGLAAGAIVVAFFAGVAVVVLPIAWLLGKL